MTHSQRRFARFAWAVLALTVLVILWGGFVRATGSGAGCGDHWPLCNGEVVPRSPTAATAIEFAHRVTSALLGLLVVGLALWAFKAYARGSRVRKAAAWSLFFVVVEGAIGAALVLFEYVAYNPAVGRAYWMAAHLVNTFLLLGALTLTAHWASGGSAVRIRGRGALGWAVTAAIVGTALLGASGAVTALGDTLAIGGGISPAEDALVSTLVGLRIYHPLLACLVLLAVGAAVYVVRTGPSGAAARRLGAAVFGLFLVQMVIGLLNVWLMAPVPLQILHLLVTDLIWIGLVLFAAEALAVPEPAPPLAVAA